MSIVLLIHGGKYKGKDICSARRIFCGQKQNWSQYVVNRVEKLYLASRITGPFITYRDALHIVYHDTRSMTGTDVSIMGVDRPTRLSNA